LDGGSAETLERARGGGKPLPAPVLQRMESGFGQRFGSVRIHDDETAAALAAQMSALAFTTGTDIFLGTAAARPEDPDGQHLLAHELAHVVQGGTAPRRFLGFGEEEDPAERQRKADRKRTDEANAHASKQTVKKSKAALQDERGRLAGERKIGVAERATTTAKITGGLETFAAVGDQGEPILGEDGAQVQVQVKSQKEKLDLDRRFHQNLEREQTFYKIGLKHLPEDEAAQEAYELAWLHTADPELRAVRPNRESEAERLVRQVRQARTAANVRDSMNEIGTRGKLLPKGVERLYEKFEALIRVLVKKGTPEADAEISAEWEVWAQADPQDLAARPRPGSPVDKQAREDARRRLAVLPSEAKGSALGAAQELGENVESKVGKAESILGVVAWATETAGTRETTSMREDAGDGFDDQKMVFEGLLEPTGGETMIPIIGGQIKAFEQAGMQTQTGVKKVPPGAVPTSTTSKIGEGFGVVTEMMTGLVGGVNGAIKFARAVQKAHSTKNPRDILLATKVGADALNAFNSSAKSTAGLAQLITPSITVSVASVVPGLNILSGCLRVISGTMGMVEGAMRVQDTQLALNEAHAAMTGGKPNVMVYPLLRVEQSYVKGLEQKVWITVKAISDLAASIATIASAGGYGIPAAYKAATDVLDLLHTLGHTIADDVLVMITKKAQKDSLLALEGSAESQLSKDPAMAVDGIIMSAVRGNKTAESFLVNYAVDLKPIDRKMLDKLNGDPANVGNETVFTAIRGAVLESMGDGADPMYTYQKYKESVGSVLGSVKKHTVDKFSDTGELAGGRNEIDGGERGVGWRLKMMFEREHQIKRAKNRLAAEKKFGSGDRLDETIECYCGDVLLVANPTAAQQKEFKVKMAAMTDAVILEAGKDQTNPPDWQDFFFSVLRDRMMAKAKAGSKR
jgi:hypothetical protein